MKQARLEYIEIRSTAGASFLLFKQNTILYLFFFLSRVPYLDIFTYLLNNIQSRCKEQKMKYLRIGKHHILFCALLRRENTFIYFLYLFVIIHLRSAVERNISLAPARCVCKILQHLRPFITGLLCILYICKIWTLKQSKQISQLPSLSPQGNLKQNSSHC